MVFFLECNAARTQLLLVEKPEALVFSWCLVGLLSSLEQETQPAERGLPAHFLELLRTVDSASPCPPQSRHVSTEVKGSI